MFILSTIILLVLLVVSCIALTVWLHRTTGELDEVNTRFDLVVAESERLRTQVDNILTLNEVLTSEKDRAFRRMRKAENLLAEYRRQGYTEYDYEALRSDYANLKAEYSTQSSTW